MKAARRQRGAVLAALLVLLVIAAAGPLLRGLAVSASGDREALATARALATAKAALLGFAAAYPDRYAGVQGPGRLPCPDTSGNGSPNPPCGSLADTRPRLGWLPDVFLGLGDLRDGAGERLWYVLSPAWRNNPRATPLNSDTPGRLELDDRTDVVALLIAPGPAGPDQRREVAAGAGPVTAPDWLEADNADGDARFASHAGNDRLLPITRTDLLAMVEPRVLGEVQAALRRHARRGAAWPWLAPWADPLADKADPANAGLFGGVAGQHHGLLPLHLPGGWFADEAVRLRWSFPEGAGARVSSRGARAPESACVRAEHCGALVSAFADGARRSLGAGAAAPPMRALCRWSDRASLDCRAEGRWQEAGLYRSAPEAPAVVFERRYALRLVLRQAPTVELQPAGPASPRQRSLQATGPVLAEFRLELSDTLPDGPHETELEFRGELGQNALGVEGLRYDLDPGPGGELPPWFVEDGWHRFALLAFAPTHAPGGESQCAAGQTCLRLARPGAGERSVPALALLAGPALPGQRRGAGAGVEAWFEQDNAPPPAVLASPLGPGRYVQQPVSGRFSDRLRVLPTP